MTLIAGTMLDYRSTRIVSAIRPDHAGGFAERWGSHGLNA